MVSMISRKAHSKEVILRQSSWLVTASTLTSHSLCPGDEVFGLARCALTKSALRNRYPMYATFLLNSAHCEMGCDSRADVRSESCLRAGSVSPFLCNARNYCASKCTKTDLDPHLWGRNHPGMKNAVNTRRQTRPLRQNRLCGHEHRPAESRPIRRCCSAPIATVRHLPFTTRPSWRKSRDLDPSHKLQEM